MERDFKITKKLIGAAGRLLLNPDWVTNTHWMVRRERLHPTCVGKVASVDVAEAVFKCPASEIPTESVNQVVPDASKCGHYRETEFLSGLGTRNGRIYISEDPNRFSYVLLCENYVAALGHPLTVLAVPPVDDDPMIGTPVTDSATPSFVLMPMRGSESVERVARTLWEARHGIATSELRRTA